MSHVKDGEPSIKLNINDGTGNFSVTVNMEQPELDDAQQIWVQNCRNANFVFRRHMLLDFICNRPRDRYKALEPFLNLDQYITIENTFRDNSEKLKTTCGKIESVISVLETKIRNIFDDEHDNPEITKEYLFGKISEKLKSLGYDACNSLDEISEAEKQIEANSGDDEAVKAFAALILLKNQTQALPSAHDYIKPLSNFIEAVGSLTELVGERTDEILTDFYVRGKDIIERTKSEICPLCEQTIDYDAVLAKLDERIANDERITAAKKLVTERKAVLKNRACQHCV